MPGQLMRAAPGGRSSGTKYLPKLVARYDGNLSQAARHAGLSRHHLRQLLVKHGIKVGSA